MIKQTTKFIMCSRRISLEYLLKKRFPFRQKKIIHDDSEERSVII